MLMEKPVVERVNILAKLKRNRLDDYSSDLLYDRTMGMISPEERMLVKFRFAEITNHAPPKAA